MVLPFAIHDDASENHESITLSRFLRGGGGAGCIVDIPGRPSPDLIIMHVHGERERERERPESTKTTVIIFPGSAQ